MISHIIESSKSLAEESIEMKTKELVIMSLLAAMGAVLHTIFPPIFSE